MSENSFPKDAPVWIRQSCFQAKGRYRPFLFIQFAHCSFQGLNAPGSLVDEQQTVRNRILEISLRLSLRSYLDGSGGCCVRAVGETGWQVYSRYRARPAPVSLRRLWRLVSASIGKELQPEEISRRSSFEQIQWHPDFWRRWRVLKRIAARSEIVCSSTRLH